MLTFTVYQLLSALSPTLQSGDLDPCMNMLIDVRTVQQLGRPSGLFSFNTSVKINKFQRFFRTVFLWSDLFFI